jgi:hypothetical protein
MRIAVYGLWLDRKSRNVTGCNSRLKKWKSSELSASLNIELDQPGKIPLKIRLPIDRSPETPPSGGNFSG